MANNNTILATYHHRGRTIEWRENKDTLDRAYFVGNFGQWELEDMMAMIDSGDLAAAESKEADVLAGIKAHENADPSKVKLN